MQVNIGKRKYLKAVKDCLGKVNFPFGQVKMEAWLSGGLVSDNLFPIRNNFKTRARL